MSVGPANGIAGGAAGSPLAKTKGAEQEAPPRTLSPTGAAFAASRRPRRPPAWASRTGGPSSRRPRRRRPSPLAFSRREEAGRGRFRPARPGPKDPAGESGNLLDLSG